MPIAVECPGCGKRYKFRDDQSGDTVPCKDCGEDIDVPAGARGGSSRAGGSKSGRRGRPRRADNQGLVVGGAIGGVVVVGLLGYVMFSGGGNAVLPPPPNAGQIPAVAQSIPVAPSPHGSPAQANQPKFGPGQKTDPKADSNVNPNAAGGLSSGGDLKLPSKADPESGFGPKAASDANNKTLVKASSSNWTAQPDPQANPITLEASRKIVMKFPSDNPSKTSVLFPHVPSTVMSVGDNASAKASRDIWDLATNTKIGSMKGMTFSSDTMALSPDGMYLAAAFQGNVDVWDVKAKKALGQFSLGKGAWGVQFLAFTRTDRLLGIGRGGEAKLLKIPSGEIEQDFQLGAQSEPAKSGISPNGRYIAYKSSGSFGSVELQLKDLESGDIVGNIKAEGATPQSRVELAHIAFSPKGDEVAALFEEGWSKDLTLIVWNMQDGSEVVSIPLSAKMVEALNVSRWVNYTPLVWFPSGQRWLVKGHGVVDRIAKQFIYRIPTSEVEVEGSRRMLTDTIVSVVDGGRNNASLLGHVLKEEVLTKTSESVQAGGLPVDGQLPSLTQPDWSSIEDVTYADRDGNWAVTPDPAPAPAERLLMRGMPLRQGKGDVQQVMVARADSARMFARVTDGAVDQGRWKEPLPKETWIDVYDLAARKPIHKFPMPQPCEIVSVSSEGTRVLMKTNEAVGRVDVYADDGKHVCGWRPYQDEPNENRREVVGAAFIDANHLATVNAGNKLVMWELPQCKAIYGIENAALPSLTQGTKYLTFADTKTYDFRDALTGKSCGEIRIEDGQGISSVAFHPNGERLAILLDDAGSLFLLDVDLKTGQASSPIPVPPDTGPVHPDAQADYMFALNRMKMQNERLARGWRGGNRALAATMPMHWCGDDHVLLNNYRLFDVKQKLIVWQYLLPVGAHISNSTDGRHWYVTTKSIKGSGPPFLVAQSMPDKLAMKEVAGRNLEPNYLLAPGKSVSVQFKLIPPPNKNGFVDEVRLAVLKALANNNVAVSDGQPLTLTLFMEKKTGQSMQYRSRNTGEVQQVQKEFVLCAAYLESGGTKHWEVSTESSNAMWSVEYRNDKSLAAVLAEGMWAGPSTYFQTLAFPRYIFDKASAQGLGVSSLTIDGTEKPPAAKPGLGR